MLGQDGFESIVTMDDLTELYGVWQSPTALWPGIMTGRSSSSSMTPRSGPWPTGP